LVESRIKAIENEGESKSLMDVEYAELMCLNSKIMKLNKHLESF
jgi:ribosomal protein S15P/S13E